MQLAHRVETSVFSENLEHAGKAISMTTHMLQCFIHCVINSLAGIVGGGIAHVDGLHLHMNVSGVPYLRRHARCAERGLCGSEVPCRVRWFCRYRFQIRYWPFPFEAKDFSELVRGLSLFPIANHLLRRYKNSSGARAAGARTMAGSSIRSMTPTCDPYLPNHDPWKDRQRSGAGAYAIAISIKVRRRCERKCE